MARSAADSGLPHGDRRRAARAARSRRHGVRARRSAAVRAAIGVHARRSSAAGCPARSRAPARSCSCSSGSSARFRTRSSRICSRRRDSAEWRTRARSSTPTAPFRRRTMNDGLIAHETAHQWFGDAVTEREWAHLWLSEGFATYFAALWTRAARGDSAFRAQMADIRAHGTRRHDSRDDASGDRHDRDRTTSRCSIATATRRAGSFCTCCAPRLASARSSTRFARYYAQAPPLDGGDRRPARGDGARVEAEPRVGSSISGCGGPAIPR